MNQVSFCPGAAIESWNNKGHVGVCQNVLVNGSWEKNQGRFKKQDHLASDGTFASHTCPSCAKETLEAIKARKGQSLLKRIATRGGAC